MRFRPTAKTLILAGAAAAFAVSGGTPGTAPGLAEPSATAMGDPRDSVGDLSPALLAGQAMMVGIPAGWSLRRPAPLDTVPAGSVILFRRNITPGMDAGDVRHLCDDIRHYLTQRHPGMPVPIIAIDHEGGHVNRLWGIPGVTAFPSSAAQVRGLSLPQATRKVEQIGRRMGEELAALGIDLDLAPVVDVVPDARRCAIGARSYAADPQRVAALAAAFVRGMQTTETRCCAKHWPGYGGVRPDPHRHVVRGSASPSRWLKSDVPPFRAAAAAGADAVMTAHVIYPFLGKAPATVNPRAYMRLRDPGLAGIRFEGPVLTDDLEMAGVAHLYPNALGRLACAAIEAGADMVLVCGRPASAITVYRALAARAAKDPQAFRVRAGRVNRLRGPCHAAGDGEPLVSPSSTVPGESGETASPGKGRGPSQRVQASSRTMAVHRPRDSLLRRISRSQSAQPAGPRRRTTPSPISGAGGEGHPLSWLWVR